jgi:hypothetical protein
VKVKLQQIVDAMPALATFAQKELPAKAAYRVSKLCRKMNSAHRDFMQAREGVLKKHGKPVEGKPDQLRLEAEDSKAANEELRLLLEEDVELEGCVPVAWADIDKLQLAPAVLADLEPFIEAPPADAPKALKAVV